jgi:hypothetical protein
MAGGSSIDEAPIFSWEGDAATTGTMLERLRGRIGDSKSATEDDAGPMAVTDVAWLIDVPSSPLEASPVLLAGHLADGVLPQAGRRSRPTLGGHGFR